MDSALKSECCLLGDDIKLFCFQISTNVLREITRVMHR